MKDTRHKKLLIFFLVAMSLNKSSAMDLRTDNGLNTYSTNVSQTRNNDNDVAKINTLLINIAKYCLNKGTMKN